ncbi:hypothetical protein BROUX41_003046 [Berkeleyomyces rouxiae]|uniref:uncharacterized protein n=1 Tax=Berkeleyomyces rouxiae TaxID=2035830 RepID=UPI003B7F5F36
MAFFSPFITSEAFASPFSVLSEFESPVYHQPLALSSPLFSAPTYTPRYCRPRRLRAPVRKSVAAPVSVYLPSPVYHASAPRPAAAKAPVFKPAFQPRFAVRETSDAYELHGDLAGLSKKDVNVEFTDSQTLVVHGRVQRSDSSAAASDEEDTPKDTHAPESSEQGAEETNMDIDSESESKPVPTPEREAEAQPASKERSQSPSHYRKATVEDSPDEDDRFSITSMTSRRSSSSESSEKRPTEELAASKPPKAPKTSRPSSPANIQADPVNKPLVTPKATASEQNNTHQAVETSSGEFSRTFTFPRRIHRDQAQATLVNGVLSISIPKVRQEPRRVVIF